MPNNIQNDITIKGPKPTLAAIMELMRGPETPFDFNKLLPMPAELQSIHTGRTLIAGVRVSQWREIDGKTVAIDAAEIVQMHRQHGASNWYDWSIEHWGTKWNAYAVSEPTITTRSLRYRFDTAWASPEIVMQALADRFQVSITVKVSGETYDGKRYSYHVSPTIDAEVAA